MAGVVEAVRQFAAAHGLVGTAGVIAVSGGADSVALLRALLDAGVGPVVAAHLNHGLRGAESDADAEFVHSLVKSLWSQGYDGLGYATATLPVADVARETGGNLEAVAREMRYDWLRYVAGPNGWVATGHTADDQAETVLHRMIRGTGIQGLRGIAPERHVLTPTRRGVGSSRIVRPLLHVTRADVLAYLADLGQPFVEDASNADPRFTRNRIRHELLPLLKTFNPEIVAVLNRLAAQATEETRERDARVAELLVAAELPRAGDRLVFDADRLAAESDALIGDLFLRVWDREGWSRNAMTFAHWRRLAGVVRGEPPAADFPGRVLAGRVGRVVRIGRRS